MDRVSVLLGHFSVKITETTLAPGFSRARRSLRRTFYECGERILSATRQHFTATQR